MAWAVEETLAFKHNSPMVFVSWLANLQYKINWTSCEISVVHRAKYQTTELAFFTLLRSCFNKSCEIWRHLRLFVLLDSGIFLTLERALFLHGNGFFPPSTVTFWRCFKECLWLILIVEWGDLTRDVFKMSWSRITSIKYSCIKEAMPWRIRVQYFFFCATKSIHDAGQASLFHLCFLTIQAFFSWITFFITVHC